MKKFIEIDLVPSSGIPDERPVHCEECDWKGAISDCETEMDSDGWEYPEYQVLVCPKCGAYSVTF